MSRRREDRTYRVRQLQVSSDISSRKLSSILAQLHDGLGPARNIEVHSVASSLSAFQNPPTSVATITFGKTPPVLDNDHTEWPFPARHLGWGRRNVIFDTHFLGFTALNDPHPDDHALDCIAISGLASHPFGSWKSRGPGSNFMWLRDGLPFDVPSIRTIIYGYDTMLWQSESFQTVQDIAISFVSRLATTGRSGPSAKPLIFLAHSLGGLVLKHALLQLANSVQRRHIFDAVQAVIFFGVPHGGMTISHLQSMVGGQPNRTLVDDLRPESTYLRVLDEQFSGLANQSLRIFSVFETKRSPTVQQRADGSWQRDGPSEILVTRDSAIHRCSHPADSVPVDRNHSELVKFAEGDSDYACILQFLQAIVPVSPYIPSLPQEEIMQRKRVSFVSDTATREARGAELLSSLRSQDMDDRLDDIAQPHEDTFEWIWTASDLDFVPWLQSKTGLYWISGKPGSGKSTLMKYLFGNRQTQQHLRSNSLGRTLICPSFFFHNRGSKSQKSLEGLLRSLLYQILSSDQKLLNVMTESFGKHSMNLKVDWSRRRLEDLFKSIMAQKNINLLLCLFVDALDEYDGDPESVISFLRSIVVAPRKSATVIKVCFSSRLYNVFIDEFGNVPGFKIHERTQKDIEKVIIGRIEASQSIQDILGCGNEEAEQRLRVLKSQLINRAEGVFLWLKLALDNILRAHRDGETMADVLRQVSSLPDELDEFYQLIVKTVLPQHRREAYVMLETVLRYDGELSVRDLSGVVACSFTETLSGTPPELVHPPLVDAAESQLARRIRSRCGGLLELETRGTRDSIVQFTHQTVKDFVARPGFRQLALPQERDMPMENGHTFLSKYGLCRLYHAADGGTDIAPHKPYLDHLTHVELTTGRSQKGLLDEMPSSRFAMAAATSARTLFEDFNSLMSFAVSRNLRLFISETFKVSGNYLVNQNPLRSLLHFAVQCETRRRTTTSCGSQDTLDMVAILLNAGADVRAIDPWGRTPFQFLWGFTGAFPSWWSVTRAERPSHDNEDLRKIVQYFLEIGKQNPNEDVVYPEVSGRRHKALHISSTLSAPLTRLLLTSGADANARDDFGRSSLDIVALTFCDRYRYDNYARLREAYETAICLLESGGRFTRNSMKPQLSQGGKRHIPLAHFAEVVEAFGYDARSIRNELSRFW